MMRRLFVCSALLFVPLVTICPQVWAQSPKLPAKSLIRVANPGALAMPGMAMPSSPFPNTYNSDANESFDPNTGSAGTLYISYHFTGTTQPNPMCNANTVHTPMVWVFITKNGTKGTGHFSQGSGIAPCVQMDQTLTMAFDLQSDGCSLSLLIDGTCGLVEQDDQVHCILAGNFAMFIKNYEFESATTVDQVVGIYPPWLLAPWCFASSDPPDWRGPIGADSFGTGYYVATNAMVRTQIFGKSFYGVPWKPLSPVGPAASWPSGGPKPICTMFDHGCSFVDQTCTAKAMPMEVRSEDVWKRRDA